jgi:BlaI family transcriptional regulator, penicillinase repressor
MAKKTEQTLSRRERQIMDIIYERGRASAVEVREAMADPPSYSAVRALLRVLMEKGHLRHTKDGPRYIYIPTKPRDQAARGAMRKVLQTFYEGSAVKAVAALLDESDRDISKEDLDRLTELIDQAKSEGR